MMQNPRNAYELVTEHDGYQCSDKKCFISLDVAKKHEAGLNSAQEPLPVEVYVCTDGTVFGKLERRDNFLRRAREHQEELIANEIYAHFADKIWGENGLASKEELKIALKQHVHDLGHALGIGMPMM